MIMMHIHSCLKSVSFTNFRTSPSNSGWGASNTGEGSVICFSPTVRIFSITVLCAIPHLMRGRWRALSLEVLLLTFLHLVHAGLLALASRHALLSPATMTKKPQQHHRT